MHFLRYNYGVTQTDHTGVTQTATIGVTHTEKVVQGANILNNSVVESKAISCGKHSLQEDGRWDLLYKWVHGTSYKASHGHQWGLAR